MTQVIEIGCGDMGAGWMTCCLINLIHLQIVRFLAFEPQRRCEFIDLHVRLRKHEQTRATYTHKRN